MNGRPCGGRFCLQMESMRLDLWLWATRFFKTRALAKAAIETGKVTVNDQRAKPSRSIKFSDQLKVTRGVETFHLTVTGLIDKRVAYKVASTMYEESAESIAAREVARAQERASATGYRAPESKPDKRARRLIRALGDIDAL